MNVLVTAQMSRWSPMAVMACFGCCCVPNVYPYGEFDCGPSVSLAASPPPSACLSPGSAQGRCASLRDGPPAHPCPDAAAAGMGWLWGAQQRPGLAHSGPSGRIHSSATTAPKSSNGRLVLADARLNHEQVRPNVEACRRCRAPTVDWSGSRLRVGLLRPAGGHRGPVGGQIRPGPIPLPTGSGGVPANPSALSALLSWRAGVLLCWWSASPGAATCTEPA